MNYVVLILVSIKQWWSGENELFSYFSSKLCHISKQLKKA